MFGKFQILSLRHPFPWLVLFLTVVFVVLAFRTYLSNTRYYTLESNDGLVYEIDRKTGMVWRFQGTEKVPVRDKQPWEEMQLPSELHEEIDLQFVYQRDKESKFIKCRGHIYNGTLWTLTEITVQLTIKPRGGDRWTKVFRQDIYARQTSNGVFILNTAETQTFESLEWQVIQYRGHPPDTIATAAEYEEKLAELRQLENQLARIHNERPPSELGLTKADLRKQIARLHELLAVYEGRLEIRTTQPERWKTYE